MLPVISITANTIKGGGNYRVGTQKTAQLRIIQALVHVDVNDWRKPCLLSPHLSELKLLKGDWC